MALFGVVGSPRQINSRLMEHALSHPPAVLVDAAECADVHAFTDNSMEALDGVFVVPAESLYRLRSVMDSVRDVCRQQGVGRLYVSSFHRLFDYGDEEERAHILEDVWERLANVSNRYEVYAAVQRGSYDEALAQHAGMRRFDDMGHTNRSQRVNTDMLLQELRQFARGLPQEDRDLAYGLIPVAQRYMGGITQAGSAHGWAMALFSMLLEQEKRMNRMEDALRGLADR